MTKALVIVESPTKVRTIKKYLGKDYNVTATVGHIKDLPPREMGIDVEKGFLPKYQTIAGKKKIITALKQAAGDATDIYLAPDPDREGEAIAWHTAEVLKKKDRKFHRVLFHELTKNAILEAMRTPRELDRSKYEAQQTRRILDRLVGYEVSPILWRKVQGGLSAGRVQSVTVRIICERERAIQAFIPEEYWSITAALSADDPPPFEAKLTRRQDKKLKITNKADADQVLRDITGAIFTVATVQRKTLRRNPLPPFTTSKLQQEAIRKLKFTARKTMMVAQQLYEGITIGDGEPEGLITYMRTDSTRISSEAAGEALALIKDQYGPEFGLPKPRFFTNKNKAQDAHEAIRPTSVRHLPEDLKNYLTKDQYALYKLIWDRFVASQMAQALIDQNSVTINAGDYQFSASGSRVQFPGFMKLYMSADDISDPENQPGKLQLPPLKEGQLLTTTEIIPKQHFTQPPPRFSEASLVKELEENGIGRPSTYASILSTIRDKGYVERDKGYFRPSELGFIVNDLLVASFPDIFDVEFTARMEDMLDRVEAGNADATQLLEKFYSPFSTAVSHATDNMLSMRGVGVNTGISCPECGKHELRIKIGKNGHYLACNGYPACTFTRNYFRDEKGQIRLEELPEVEASDQKCPKCQKPMVVKQGKFGPFLACSGYPECKTTLSLSGETNGNSTGVKCPEAGCAGQLMERRSKRGKIFFGCSRFPDCTYASWDKPIPSPCPICKSPFMLEKSTKRDGHFLACPDTDCGHREAVISPMDAPEKDSA
ncbi:MAG: type I DNA topoisomerase [Pseudomonadota bacterium]